jgi:large repetitive protein
MRFEHSAAIKSYRAGENSVLQLLALSLVLCLAALGTGCAASSATGTSTSPATPDSQLKLSPPTAQGTVGVAYNAVSSVSGGTPPYFFSVASGSLPPGLVLNSTTGSVTGTPSAAGTYKFTLNVSSAVKGHEPITPDVVAPFPVNAYASSAASIVVSAKGTALTISPSSATLVSQESQQFSAKTSGSADTGVTWSATAGTISSTGVFTAPKVTSGTTAVIVTAMNTHTNSQAAATVTVTPLTPLAITTSAVAGAETAMTYSATLSATGGVTPYQWTLASGALPSGIQLQTTGIISGMATLAGSYPFTAKVTDSTGNSATIALSLTVTATSQSNFDGPAELPRIYIQTAMSNTPAPGSTISVNAGGDLQSALNSASCGDTIQLQAGATFTGVFTFPAKNCDANHWIIVRTSADDSVLPAEGLPARSSCFSMHFHNDCYSQADDVRNQQRTHSSCLRCGLLSLDRPGGDTPGRNRDHLCLGVDCGQRHCQQHYF